MGTAPPPDGPAPAAQQQQAQAAIFQLGPPVASLCGFKLPTLSINLSLPPVSLPSLPFPPKLPTFKLSIGINCASSNPLDISGGIAWGGGRVSNADPRADDLADQAT